MKRLFVVEDDAVGAMDLEHHLRRFGYEVCGRATTGDAALLEIPVVRPDLVIMDISLGEGMSGLDVAGQLRPVIDVPVIFLTAYSDEELTERAGRIGSFAYVTKPCDPRVLRANIELALGRHEITTALRESEARLRRSEIQLNETQALARLGSWEWDLAANSTEWSANLYKIFGVTREFFEGGAYEAFVSLVHPEDRADVVARMKDALAAKGSFECQYRIVRPDGVERRIEARASVSVDDAGRAIAMRGSSQDITERARMASALTESEDHFRQVVGNIRDALFIDDIAGMIIFANEQFFTLFGLQPGNLAKIQLEHYVAPEWRARLRDRHDRRVRGEAVPTHFEYEGIRTDGRRLWLEVDVTPLLDGAGRVTQTQSTVRDITARKQAEADREKLQTQLTQAQKLESVGRLAGGVAHDFNNMLGVILGHAEMALETLDPGLPLFGALLEIQKAAERSANLTRQLLAFARKQTVARKVLDLNATVEGMIKMLRRLIGEDINLEWRPCAGGCLVNMDPSQIDQILANLCLNARDAISGVGKIAIQTESLAFDELSPALLQGIVPGEYTLLSVSDDGCGMDAETRGNIFEPFFTTKARGSGTGLGLATVYGIVKQNNGFINVDSEPGKGSTFRIHLPRHAAGTGLPPEKDPATPAARGVETILVVEDESSILEMTAKMLRPRGYTVLTASTPGEAIRLAREHAGEIHLLLTDVVMPEMNGRDLAKNLMSLRPSLRRLYMSGYTSDVIAAHGVLEEGVHFIRKPFSMRDLAAKVRETLDA